MSNFSFLKKNDTNLFNIISEAENLFRDEYFEQSMVQTRRYGENLCKELLKEKVLPDDTFDTMINKIKDNSFQNIRMKELYEDLYFLKKHSNSSAHSSSLNKKEEAGKIALECLERAYEIAIFYSNIKYGYDKKLDKTVFSEELLMTGKKTAKKSSPILKEKYEKELEKNRTKAIKTVTTKKVSKSVSNATSKSTPKTTQKLTPKPKKKQTSKKKKKNNGKKVFLVLATIVIALASFLYWVLSY